MPENASLILNHQTIEQKINRIAYQIYEDHYDHEHILIIGIAENGYSLAQLISKKLEEISSIKVLLSKLKIDKKKPLNSKIELSLDPKSLKKESIIVVDDVLNSGRTMMYAIKPLLEQALNKISLAVLINRSHKRFPIYADYVGLSLATTLKEHIEVKLSKNDYAAYLS